MSGPTPWLLPCLVPAFPHQSPERKPAWLRLHHAGSSDSWLPAPSPGAALASGFSVWSQSSARQPGPGFLPLGTSLPAPHRRALGSPTTWHSWSPAAPPGGVLPPQPPRVSPTDSAEWCPSQAQASLRRQKKNCVEEQTHHLKSHDPRDEMIPINQTPSFSEKPMFAAYSIEPAPTSDDLYFITR